MRVGDFSVDVIPADGSTVRELDSGHVLARPGQVYQLRLRNHGPLRCVADVSIDGHAVTGGGLVIGPWSTVDLERPIHATERGRFTVVAEGDEHVFGPDGGRDNPDLGLIEARFRRELPQPPTREAAGPREFPPSIPRPLVTFPPVPGPAPQPVPDVPPRRPGVPPEWTPPTWNGPSARLREPLGGQRQPGISALMAATSLPLAEPAEPAAPAAPTQVGDAIERAAGTGLTGSSGQEFVPTHVGPLEAEATVIQLRLVIGTEEALAAPHALPDSEAAPARPAARP